MKIRERSQAIALRKQGRTLNEIASELGVAKSSVSLWVRNLNLPERAIERIASLQTAGQKAARISKLQKTRENLYAAKKDALVRISNISIEKDIATATCALLYWCEGAKSRDDKVFTFSNSDPLLVAAFMRLMRMAF